MANPLYNALFGRHRGNEATFLLFEDGGRMSYAGFVSLAARYAGALRAAGLAAGDRVAVQLDKSEHALALYAGAVQAGVVFLPLNTAYTAAEVSYFVTNSGARLLVAAATAAPALADVARQAGARLAILDADGSGDFGALAADAPGGAGTAARDPGDLAAILYTSGTTGRSKGAMLSQRNLLSNAEVLRDAWAFTEDDVLLHALPIFHTHGLFVATNITLLAGGAMILMPRFDADRALDLMPRATAMMGVPTFYTRLLDNPRLTPDAAAHMRLFVSGSAPLAAETHVAWEARTGHRILERYGMTETNMNTSNPYDGERRAGTVGRPLPGVELKVTDPETGTALPPGEIGQIEVRGPNVFLGYWQMPDKTAEDLRPDGFFQTGDLGRLGPDGYLEIIGRSKDLIISGGYNVYPKEVEAVLDAQPGVRESAVIGVPHPDLGEAAIAVIVADEPAPAADTLEAAMAERLARYKRPRRLIFAEALPRNAMGKVQKAMLRDAHAGTFVR